MKRRAKDTREAKKRLDEKADEAERESFPASDPPAFTPTVIGAPDSEPTRPSKPQRPRKKRA